MVNYRIQLDQDLERENCVFKDRKIEVTGYSLEHSPEGEIWQYRFTSWWPCEIEIVSITILANWYGDWGTEAASILSLSMIAEIFKRGAPSTVREQWGVKEPMTDVIKLGLVKLVDREMSKGIERLSAYNITLNLDERQLPLAI